MCPVLVVSSFRFGPTGAGRDFPSRRAAARARSAAVLSRTSAIASTRSSSHPSTDVTPATRTVDECTVSGLADPFVTGLMRRKLNRSKPVRVSVGEPQQHRDRLDLNLRVRISLKQRRNYRSDVGDAQLLRSTGFARQSMKGDRSNRSYGVGQGCYEDVRRGIRGMVVEKAEAAASCPRVRVVDRCPLNGGERSRRDEATFPLPWR